MTETPLPWPWGLVLMVVASFVVGAWWALIIWCVARRERGAVTP